MLDCRPVADRFARSILALGPGPACGRGPTFRRSPWCTPRPVGRAASRRDHQRGHPGSATRREFLQAGGLQQCARRPAGIGFTGDLEASKRRGFVSHQAFEN
jgi:hypothetical protein